MRRIGWLLAALLLAGTASSPAFGVSQSELDAVEREKARMAAELEDASDEVRAAGAVLADTRARLPEAEHAVDVARGRVAAAESEAAQAEREADAAREALAAAEAEYEAAAAVVEEARESRAAMFNATARGAELLTVDAILASEDPAEAIDGLTYLEFLMEGKDQAVEEVTLARREAANAENTAAVAEAEAEAAEAAAAQALADAQVRVAEAEAAQLAVQRLQADQEAALAVAEAERADAQSEYDELEAESERLADELRRQDDDDSGGGGPSSGGGGGGDWVVPVDGWKSSDFGWRIHPIYGSSRFHGGTDFAAGSGTTIHAVDSGRVVYAGWNAGYGKLTCISHGGGVTSCYAHQSSIWVSYGEHVDRDEGIGAVGTTGASTGPHLHFEVRVHGERVNPLGYLPACLCR
ncbi:M23 family metallopeptidase [Glycomyces albidus]|jgi:murein DD-endopeptidase MepM/ murein hydrolase activator NlpD|uniref:Peptidoglycan DD-metalloendopeptidase family protein n=1 Tax=Glycomyces albidus TaxID=2656774 RepID=A0A6L5G729_9ACTN|nr:M23 family metallopeptidase [Glycomyces albidus]MQM25446.1 peptidoglycan DD-metalloendopeptidase family protein [Glycomyces albidus]